MSWTMYMTTAVKSSQGFQEEGWLNFCIGNVRFVLVYCAELNYHHPCNSKSSQATFIWSHYHDHCSWDNDDDHTCIYTPSRIYSITDLVLLKTQSFCYSYSVRLLHAKFLHVMQHCHVGTLMYSEFMTTAWQLTGTGPDDMVKVSKHNIIQRLDHLVR